MDLGVDRWWYDCRWYDKCNPSGIISWDNYVECQQKSPEYGSKEDERLECDHIDTENEDYWKCYWDDINCLETAGDRCWHTLNWFDTCEEVAEITWENYLIC